MDLEKALKDLQPVNQVEIAFKILLENCCASDFGKGDKECIGKVIESINYLHPTHRQSFARFIQKIIAYYADQYDKKYFDMRDEASCKLFAELHKISKEQPLPFF